WAVAYREFSADYVDAETAAQTARRNIWNGTFQQPEDFRKQTAATANAAATNPRDCKIKGNIGSSGDRIYHVPGGRFYAKTQISIARGERFFCTQNEAQAAGWRPSRR